MWGLSYIRCCCYSLPSVCVSTFDLRQCLVVNAGDSGQGMTGGTIAGIVIGDLITGRKNPWAEVYSPQRLVKGLSSMQGLAEEMAQNIKVRVVGKLVK